MSQQHFLQDVPLRDFVLSTPVESPERDVLDQITRLSLEIFHEDAVDEYSKPGVGGRLWVIYDYGSPKSLQHTETPTSISLHHSISIQSTEVSDDDSNCTGEPGTAGRPRLLGFLIGKLIQKKAIVSGGEAFNIIYACVPQELRGKGTGKKLVNATLKQAKERQNIALVSCWALPNAIKFWQRCGLKVDSSEDDDAAMIENGKELGQRYMEIKTAGKRGKKTNRRKKA